MDKKPLFIIICLISIVLFIVIFISLLDNSKVITPTNIQDKIGSDLALKIITNRIEVIKYEAELNKSGKKARFEIQDDGDEWLVQVFEIVQNNNELPHTATFNWYRVNKKTGEVEAEF